MIETRALPRVSIIMTKAKIQKHLFFYKYKYVYLFIKRVNVARLIDKYLFFEQKEIMKRLFRKHRLGVRVSTLLLVVILAFPFGGPTAAFAQNPHRNLNAAPIAPDWTLSILKNSPVSQQGMVELKQSIAPAEP